MSVRRIGRALFFPLSLLVGLLVGAPEAEAMNAENSVLEVVGSVPADRWVHEPARRIRVTHARPWSGLAVEQQGMEIGFPLDSGLWIEARASRTRAGTVVGGRSELRLRWVHRALCLTAGAARNSLRIAARAERVEWEGHADLRVGVGPAVLGLRWQPPPRGAPATGTWSAVARLRPGPWTLTVERRSDRWGTGTIWHRALVVDVLGTLDLGLVWSADDTAALLGVRWGDVSLRVLRVLDGPRVGGQGLALGWSP